MNGLQKYAWIAGFLFSFVSATCLSNCKAESALPEQAIVFEKATFGEKVTLGLVNADGSNLEYFTFHLPAKRWVKFPVWSPDKTKFIYLVTPNTVGGSGDLVWVDIAQAEAKATCTSSSSGTKAWRIDDRPRWTPDGKWWLAMIFDNGIGLVDPKTCEIEQVLVLRPENGNLRSPDLSVLNELVYDMILYTEARPGYGYASLGHIMVKDLNTGETRDLGQGMLPSWSPDGNWIVFTGQDGVYLMRRDGSERHRLLEVTPWWDIDHATLEPLRASWSPDGQWVVYDKRVFRDGAYYYDIYKLNVDTGEEAELVKEGSNPYWHWGPKSIIGRSQQ